MLFAELKTGALFFRPYSDVDNNCGATIQKLSWFPSLILLNNKDVDINKTILIFLYTLYEFLRRLLYNCGTKTLRKIPADQTWLRTVIKT
jgi:hypothetical protein